MQVALELRGEDHVHEHQREEDGGLESSHGLRVELGTTAHVGRVAGWEPDRRRLAADRLERVAERLARCDVAEKRYLPLPVLALDLAGARPWPDRHDVLEADLAERARRNRQPGQRRRRVAIGLAQPEAHIVEIGSFLKLRHDLPGDHHSKCARDVGDAHTHVRRFCAVDMHLELRLSGLRRGVDVDDPRHGLHAALELAGQVLDASEVGASNVVVDLRGAEATSAHRRRIVDADARERPQRHNGLPHVVHDRKLVTLPVVMLGQEHNNLRGRDRVALASDRGEQSCDLRNGTNRPLGRTEDLVDARERDPLRKLHVHFELGAVVLGHEGRPDSTRNGRNGNHECDRQPREQPAMVHRPSQQHHVAAVDRREEPGVPRPMAATPTARSEPPRTEDRREREGHQQRHHDGEGHRDPEAIEEPPGDPGNEGERDEHRHE